jgi:hypothetical protein
MKAQILLMAAVASGLLMLSSVYAGTITEDAQDPVEFMTQFYAQLGSSAEITVAQCSPFRQIQLKGFTYLIAKEFITHHPGSQQEVLPVVIDVVNNWTKVMSWPAYQQFMVLGNRVNLEEPNLN